MFQTLLNVFRVPELRNKVLFTLLMLAIYRIGFHIPLPGVDQTAFQERLDVFQRVNVEDAMILFDDVTDMRGQNHVIQPPQRMVRRQRLVAVHIQPRAANRAALQPIQQRRLVHDWTA